MKELKEWTLQEVKEHCFNQYNCGDCKVKKACEDFCRPLNKPYKWKLEVEQ